MPGECHMGEFEGGDGTLPCLQGRFGSWQFREKSLQVRREPSDDLPKQIKKVLSYLGEHRKVLEQVLEGYDETDVLRIAKNTNLSYMSVNYILGTLGCVYWKLPKIVRKGDTITVVGPPLAYGKS